MASSSLARRRFLMLAASAAASAALAACGAPTPQPPAQVQPAAAVPPTPAPTAAGAAAPTTAPFTVSVATPTSAPAAPIAAATTQTAATGKYKEAPQLADLVKQGKLPPVDQRLPENPRVLTPIEEVGQYGGVWHRAYRGLSDRWGPTKLNEAHLIKWESPDPNSIVIAPNVLEKWEQSADGTEFTFHFRKGIKWSDGAPVTAEDMRFWYEDIQLNKDLMPEPSYLVRQKVGDEYKMAQMTVVDDATVKVKYPAPNPLLLITLATSDQGFIRGSAGFLSPSKYLKQFHPKYADKAALDKLVKDKGLATWTDLWGKAGDMQCPVAFWLLNPDLPVLSAWKIQTPPPADPMVMVRNPYIDRIDHAFFQDFEVLKVWVAGGKIDCQMRHMDPGAYTFYKENEKKGDYRVLNWRAAATDCYFPNINCPDKTLAKLFDTPDFRQALNVTINRKELKEVVWNGLGTPRQYAPVKGSPEYDEGMTQAWAEYDPAKANQLLDKLGLAKGPDGIRKRPDGKPLEAVIIYIDAPGSATVDAHKLVLKYWEAIGVRGILKPLERGLLEQSDHNADLEIGAGFAWDSQSVNKASPDIWLGTLDDNPWAPAYGHWYTKAPYKQEEPPKDHPIRKIWDLWEKTQSEPDEAKSNAYFQQIIGIHKQAPVAVGTVGEHVVPMIAKNSFRNVKGGYVQDDPLRDYGLINPQQFYIRQ